MKTKFCICHKLIAEQLNSLINGEEEIPGWFTKGRTVSCLKDSLMGNAADNYELISCLQLMWNLLLEELYKFLEMQRNQRLTVDRQLGDVKLLTKNKSRNGLD